jgi:hypothetical protein
MTFTEFQKTMKFRYLPNVSRIRIETVSVNLFALVFGIERKDRSMHIQKFKNLEQMNKYLNRQYSRLYKYAREDEIVQFERLALILIRHSKVYQICMLHHATETWYCKSKKNIVKIWNKIRRINIKADTNLNYERWWIDKKPGDAGRPLGAPKIEWKVVLLQYLQILEIFYRSTGKITTWQHAGLSKRGLVTAWEDVIKNALNHEYIYEFDLKGFFDRVKNQNVLSELPVINLWFNQVNNAKPSKCHLPKVEEDRPDPYKQAMRKYLEEILSPGPELDEMIQYYEDNPDEIMLNITLGKPTEDKETYKWRSDRREEWKGLSTPDHGYPQGANTSPFLSCLTLMKAVGEIPGLIMYMDDGIIYANTKKELNKRIEYFKTKLTEIGLELEPSKSKLVKEGGKFEGLKFLGIRLTKDLELHSETRKGTIKASDLKPTDLDHLESLMFAYNVPRDIVKDIWEQLIEDFTSDESQMTNSEKRISKWLKHKALDKLKGIQWAIEKGFFSNEIARIFNPSEEGTLDLQYKGELEKLNLIGKVKSFSREILELAAKKGKAIHTPLQSISSVAISRYLKSQRRIKGSRLMRSK